MSDWDGWPAERAALVLCVVLLAGVWVQVTLMHWAGGFKSRAMWGPVIATPLFVLAALVGVITRDGAVGWIVAVLLWLAVLEGLVGLMLHLRGIVGQIGGMSLRNVLSGPPPVLPLAYSLIGLLGAVAVMWDA